MEAAEYNDDGTYKASTIEVRTRLSRVRPASRAAARGWLALGVPTDELIRTQRRGVRAERLPAARSSRLHAAACQPAPVQVRPRLSVVLDSERRWRRGGG